MKISFVILHYQNIDDTKQCVESILALKKVKKVDIDILIIDNDSPNKTGKSLENLYKNDDKIRVEILAKNYGFSKANNIGYNICKENGANYIIMLNNDIVFEDKNFLVNLTNNKHYFDNYEIIAPDIINLNGDHQNPNKIYPASPLKCIKNIVYRFLIIMLLKIPFISRKICLKENQKEAKWMEKYYLEKRTVNGDVFVPFGAFLIFTNKWIEKENIAFPSNTFLYMEEDTLSVYLSYKKYKIMYCEDLCVRHKEGRSVAYSNTSNVSRLSFRYKNIIKANIKYLKFLKRYKVR